LSPSPRILSHRPCSVRVRSRNGSSGARLSLNASSFPSSSGQKVFGTTPVGEKTITSRCLRAVEFSNPRLGRFDTKGKAAALSPSCLRNWRRERRVFLAGFRQAAWVFVSGAAVGGTGRQDVSRRVGANIHKELYRLGGSLTKSVPRCCNAGSNYLVNGRTCRQYGWLATGATPCTIRPSSD